MTLFLVLLFVLSAAAQDAPPQRGPDGFRGPGGPGGFGGFGGVREDRKLLKQFDKDGDKRLNLSERKAAREFIQKERAEGRGGRGGFRGPGGPPPQPGIMISQTDVKNFGDAPLYDPKVLRTIFLEFESPDWYAELVDFNNSDVEVPATMIVDGKVYKEVGVHFRGASSFGVGEGQKRSMNLDLDFVHEDQEIGGYRTLNLLNSHRDPAFLRTVLYYEVARKYIPAPKANFVRVVINGENWGIYPNAQQFNKDFVRDNFGTTKGARWKVPGSPRGNGGLTYLGEDPAEYKRIYEIKTKDDPKSWSDLIRLCRVLNQTPIENLEGDLAPMLDLEGTLKFLALENVLINSDGYWIRKSDYNLYQDEQGQFHIIPHDANETFAAPQGPGMRGGGAGVALSPVEGEDDPSKPLLHRLLKVPSLRSRYFGYVRHIAENWLDWQKLAPVAESYQTLIAADVKADTRKLDSYEAFETGLTQDEGRRMSIKTFVDKRREFLLNHEDVKNATAPLLPSAPKNSPAD